MSDRRAGRVTEPPEEPPLPRQIGWRVLDIALIVVGVMALAAVVWLAIDVLLLLFGAVLLANFLRAPTDELVRRTRLPDPVALTFVVLILLGALSMLGWLLAPSVVAQVPELVENLTDTLTALNRELAIEEHTEALGGLADLQGFLPSASGLIGSATGLISSTFGALANVVILVVVALYLAATPRLYLDGMVRLLPKERRERPRATMRTIGRTLRWWVIGQLISMSAVGLMSYVGLSLLGVPLALALAVIAFLFTFVPFIGPALSAIPVVLVAFSQSPETALLALALYVIIQSFEGYFLTPLVHRRSVALPPALTISAQVVFGVLFGLLGVVFATPLAAAGLVAVKMLYIEDVLGDEAETRVPEART